MIKSGAGVGRGHSKSNSTFFFKILIAAVVLAVVVVNFMALNWMGNGDGSEDGRKLPLLDHLHPNPSGSNRISNAKKLTSTSFYWPSINDGGLLRKIHQVQNPIDCSSPNTKFLVWQSMRDHEKDTRGLTAWGHSGASQMLHAFTDGDEYEKTMVSRVLINDDKHGQRM